jgi:hypothetical protein
MKKMIFLFVVLMNQSAYAEMTIHHKEHHHRVTLYGIEKYLRYEEPGFWETPRHRRGFEREEAILWLEKHGRLEGGEILTYLEWRRGLDPGRFDHYHPRLGALLWAEGRYPVEVPALPPMAAIPEPSTLLLAAIGIGVGFFRNILLRVVKFCGRIVIVD